ncbi:MAG TPA: endoribonuclease MazF [Peptococcaceae bacterium]|nr:MAG: Growth inhibitor [Clostridia bacterium 41_269]HBT19941.1 endoribonuclease MazF [Peptococcaceae bacterium]
MVSPSSRYVPDRGDIVWLQFNPQAGHEQAGLRPAIVISPKAYNGKTGLALMCPITSKTKGYPFEAEQPENLDISGVILADQIKSLDWRARSAQFVCKAPVCVIEEVLSKITVLLS